MYEFLFPEYFQINKGNSVDPIQFLKNKEIHSQKIPPLRFDPRNLLYSDSFAVTVHRMQNSVTTKKFIFIFTRKTFSKWIRNTMPSER